MWALGIDALPTINQPLVTVIVRAELRSKARSARSWIIEIVIVKVESVAAQTARLSEPVRNMQNAQSQIGQINFSW
jgi:hypothetical protein